MHQVRDMWIQDQLRAAIETKQQHEAFMKTMRLEEIELERKKELRADKLEACMPFCFVSALYLCVLDDTFFTICSNFHIMHSKVIKLREERDHLRHERGAETERHQLSRVFAVSKQIQTHACI